LNQYIKHYYGIITAIKKYRSQPAIGVLKDLERLPNLLTGTNIQNNLICFEQAVEIN
jgi:hypothetical protein